MENYAITKLEGRISAIESELRRLQLETRAAPLSVGNSLFEKVISAIGFAVICIGGGLILTKLISLLVEA